MKKRLKDVSILRSSQIWCVVISILAALPLLADPVHSFVLQGGAMADDVPPSLNTNGLYISGQTGAWALITTTITNATDDGVTLTFSPADWGGTVGTRGVLGAQAIRNGTFLANEDDIPWALTGLVPNATYNMIWYSKNLSETRTPNTGVNGFDAGNGVGASAPLDADYDQNFLNVEADSSGTISGTWFLAGGLQDITAVAGVQVVLNSPPPPKGTVIILH
jgi:hypothetical protein